MADVRNKAESGRNETMNLKRIIRPVEEPEDTVIIPCFNAITITGKEKENVRNGERRKKTR